MVNKKILLIIAIIKNTHSFTNELSWNLMSKTFKHSARNWFIKRAEKKGIPWNNLTQYYKQPNINENIKANFNNLKKQTSYPNYYIKSFHGYDDGNLNWLAAIENEASTLSMSSNYWEHETVENSANYIRNNFTQSIDRYNSNNKKIYYNDVLDIGCSIGISTNSLLSLPLIKNLYGIDLSPYFISVAQLKYNNVVNMFFSNQSFVIRFVCLSNSSN